MNCVGRLETVPACPSSATDIALSRAAGTIDDILAAWPEGEKLPAPTTLFRWHRAVAEHRVSRTGKGSKTDPHRFQLPDPKNPLQDLSEIEPLRVD